MAPVSGLEHPGSADPRCSLAGASGLPVSLGRAFAVTAPRRSDSLAGQPEHSGPDVMPKSPRFGLPTRRYCHDGNF